MRQTDVGSAWWVRHAEGSEGGVLLACFPFAGGGAASYRAWARSLPTTTELLAFQPPGRQGRFREPPVEDFDDLMAAAEPHLDLLTRKPVVLFGHSMGALLAFEAARVLLRRWGVEVQHLIVSGRRAPHIVRDEEALHLLSDGDLKARLGDLEGTPQDVLENEELLSLMLPVLRADFRLVQCYRFRDGPKLGVPITVFGGTDDDISGEDLREWSCHTTGEVTVRMFTGGHFFLSSAEDALMSAVTEVLRRAG